jgi:hypothetical protein
MRRVTIAVAVLAALGVTAVAPAKTRIKPKAGGYAGKITDKDGKGRISMVYATFEIDGKDRKAMQLFDWTGILKCEDGTTRETTGYITAPLKGTKFSGKSTSNGETLSFSGKWTSNTKVSGTVRMKVTAPQVCDTGPITFKVKHT